uniref:Tail collar fiber protein n=2 Tax=unclassified Caudoviricetes TaxID=2788787 RepID=A0A8S5MB06_9CAUD|nr:MAG TPA: tail collar fiber protein [Siphoviridae sp. ctsDY37]DAF96015.1 MAG TPA: tail collar fiber protein [Siphoviridae sp. cteLB10]
MNNMAEFNKLIITNKGQALMAKLIAGTTTVEFTKIRTSTNVYTNAQILALTALANVKQTTDVSRVIRTNNVAVQVEGAIENSNLTTGYKINSVGLYAKDPDEGEILYAVASVASSDNGAWMPPYNGVAVSGAYFKLITTVSNSDNVSLQVDQAAVATVGDIQDLQSQISDLEAFIGYKDDDIYGVEVDFVNKKFTRLAGAVGKTGGASFDGVHCFGGRRRCNLTDDGKVIAYHGDTGYSETGALTQAITIDETTYAAGTKVQTMVEQPKFYYKVVPLELEIISEGDNYGHHMRKGRYYISPVPKLGFKLHPAFIRDGKEKDFVYLSAFEGSLYDVSASAYILDDSQVASFVASTGDKLSSIANAKPMSGLTQDMTRAKTRIIAENRGTGWEQETVQMASASQLLMLVEYASFNMQTAIGNGNVSKTDDGTTNMAENTGATTSLGNASGVVTNTNGILIVSYRGEENPWGNIWKWVDGINIQNPSPFAAGQYGNVYVADHGFADGISASPYEDTGIHPCYGEGYVSAFGYNEKFDWLFIPTEHSGNSSLPVGDYMYNNQPGWRVALLGGGWYDGSRAGAFYWNLGNAASNRNRNVGGRLVYVPDVA